MTKTELRANAKQRDAGALATKALAIVIYTLVLCVVALLIHKFVDKLNSDELRMATASRPSYELRMTITYNAVSLQEAAEIEDKVRALCADACRIETNITPVQEATIECTGYWIVEGDDTCAVEYEALSDTVSDSTHYLR